MRFGFIKIKMGIMEELDQIMGDGGSFQYSTLAWIKEGINNGEEPVTHEGLIAFAEEGCLGDVPDLVDGFWRVRFGYRSLLLLDPLPWIFKVFSNAVKDPADDLKNELKTKVRAAALDYLKKKQIRRI